MQYLTPASDKALYIYTDYIFFAYIILFYLQRYLISSSKMYDTKIKILL